MTSIISEDQRRRMKFINESLSKLLLKNKDSSKKLDGSKKAKEEGVEVKTPAEIHAYKRIKNLKAVSKDSRELSKKKNNDRKALMKYMKKHGYTQTQIGPAYIAIKDVKRQSISLKDLSELKLHEDDMRKIVKFMESKTPSQRLFIGRPKKAKKNEKKSTSKTTTESEKTTDMDTDKTSSDTPNTQSQTITETPSTPTPYQTPSTEEDMQQNDD